MSSSTLTLSTNLTPAQIKQRISLAVDKSLKECREQVKDFIRKSKPAGRIYRRGLVSSLSGGGAVHRASRRGQAPAIDSGKLISSIRAQKTGDVKGEVSVNVPYAEKLENTMNRPFMKPAAKKYLPKFERNIRTAL